MYLSDHPNLLPAEPPIPEPRASSPEGRGRGATATYAITPPGLRLLSINVNIEYPITIPHCQLDALLPAHLHKLPNQARLEPPPHAVRRPHHQRLQHR
ncbi:hypothetical protein EVG20_g4388 [Dentipellis fragilis]|uniref:Uncharacterized protein n=1 Tax=Dentipellis fragilis TaxID=205917 RepID=A0A4Y9YW88_9AGAM|nr:hypothetical protein EVG20_g4388 [Dentipellis fragilis]